MHAYRSTGFAAVVLAIATAAPELVAAPQRTERASDSKVARRAALIDQARVRGHSRVGDMLMHLPESERASLRATRALRAWIESGGAPTASGVDRVVASQKETVSGASVEDALERFELALALSSSDDVLEARRSALLALQAVDGAFPASRTVAKRERAGDAALTARSLYALLDPRVRSIEPQVRSRALEFVLKAQHANGGVGASGSEASGAATAASAALWLRCAAVEESKELRERLSRALDRAERWLRTTNAQNLAATRKLREAGAGGARRSSSGDEGEAACRGRCGGGSASPASKGTARAVMASRFGCGHRPRCEHDRFDVNPGARSDAYVWLKDHARAEKLLLLTADPTESSGHHRDAFLAEYELPDWGWNRAAGLNDVHGSTGQGLQSSPSSLGVGLLVTFDFDDTASAVLALCDRTQPSAAETTFALRRRLATRASIPPAACWDALAESLRSSRDLAVPILIESLEHEDLNVRRCSDHLLRAITGEDFGFVPARRRDDPRNVEALEAWRAWRSK